MSGAHKGWQSYAGYCDRCRKKTYWSRRQARSAARVVDSSMSAYPCGPFWHVGHLPKSVVVGRETRDEFRARSRDRWVG